MNKFLRNVRSSSNKDDLIKKSITAQLSHSIKQIHYCALEENKNSKVNDVVDAANTLSTAVEAMFLHGLRDSLTHRFRKALSDLDNQPEPSFWSPLLVLSHRQIIDQVTDLSQISTEVGHCRAWIRTVLNDCLLSSYLMTMRQDTSVLKSFYKPSAFVRDSDLLDVTQRLIEGIEVFKLFTLPCNSSLLNSWPVSSLVLAGIWVPAMKVCSVTPCDDIAQSLEDISKAHLTVDTASDTVSLSSAMSINSQASSLRQVVALSEDEILKIILSKPADRGSPIPQLRDSPSSQFLGSPSSQLVDDSRRSPDIPENTAESITNNASCSLGNQLNRRSGWSFEDEPNASDRENEVNIDTNKSVEETKKKSSSGNRASDTSFKALIDSYSMLSGSCVKTPDLKEVMQKFNSEITSPEDANLHNNNKHDIPLIREDTLPEPISLVSYVTRICQEKGLDAQNFECADCKAPLAVTCKPRICAFTGEYFCDNCMSDEEMTLPARVIHNWDYRPYPISKKAAAFISEVKDDPLIDFKVLNPYIYGTVEQMSILQTLRNQLNFLRAYLYTCREPVIEQLQKMMWPREYLYEHIHQYSISDLYQIQSNELAQEIEKVIAFGREHVSGCWLCSQKGFVCEICDKPKALFPFDVHLVYRCDDCNAVYHKGCLTANKPCPKCERRRKRGEPLDAGSVM